MAANLFAGESVKQLLLWGVVNQFLTALLGPTFTEIANLVNSHETTAALSPADAALAVLRGTWLQDRGAQEAAYSGISADLFDVITKNTGEPISVDQALALWKRHKIDDACLEQVVRQSRLRPEYLPQVKALGEVVLGVSDAVDAVVESQISKDQGIEIAAQNGVSKDDFQILIDTRGRPPGPAELLEGVRRGLLPVDGLGPEILSLDQGIAESAVKTKWTSFYHGLLEYLPPPRTVTALERAAAITPEQAQQLYQQAGLSPELAAAYSADASHQKTATHKNIAVGTVLSMYRERFIPTGVATSLLGALGYTSDEAAQLLAWEDVQRELAVIKAAITRVGNLYVNRKIGTTTVHNDLNALGLPPEQIDELIRVWTIERSAKVAVLTAGQIATAYQHTIIDQPTAVAALRDLGYSDWAAWLYLSQHVHQPLPDQPPPDASGVGGLP